MSKAFVAGWSALFYAVTVLVVAVYEKHLDGRDVSDAQLFTGFGVLYLASFAVVFLLTFFWRWAFGLESLGWRRLVLVIAVLATILMVCIGLSLRCFNVAECIINVTGAVGVGNVLVLSAVWVVKWVQDGFSRTQLGRGE